MSSGAFTSAGTTIGIVADAPSTYDPTGFEALTFELIGEVTDLGEFGREYSLVTHNPLGDRQTVKRKGSYNDGSISMTVARVPSDAGQTLLRTPLTAMTTTASTSPFRMALNCTSLLRL